MLKSFLEENLHNPVFVRNSFRRYIVIAIFLLCVNYSIILYSYYKLFTIKQSPTFATTTDGRIIDIYPD